MRIRTILLTLLGVQLALVGGLIGLALLMHQTQLETEEAEHRRYTSFRLADELRQSSDDLTRFARTYATTGDKRYEEYFRLILAIRNGDVPRPAGYEGVYWDLVAGRDDGTETADGEAQPLRVRMLDVGFTTTEFEKLAESQNRSDALVRLENVAMNAVKGRFDHGTGKFELEGPPDRGRAIELLHGREYHEAKAAIMEPIGEFMEMIERRTEAEVLTLNARERLLEQIDIVLASLLLLTTLVSVVLIGRRVLRPIEEMAATAERVSASDLSARAPVPPSGGRAAFGSTLTTWSTRSTDRCESSKPPASGSPPRQRSSRKRSPAASTCS